MGVLDGEDVNQTITNTAFINKNNNDVMPYILAFSKPSEGADIASIQAATNKLYTCTGASESVTGTAYNATASTIINGTSHLVALTTLANKFDPNTGHNHNGGSGNGALVPAGAIASVPLLGYIQTGTQFSASGSSNDVSTYLSGKTPSSNSTTAGIPVTSPQNKIRIQNAIGYDILDSNGNTVYGRLSYLSSVWTLSYYSQISGGDVAFTMPVAQTINWWYPELFNPLNTPPNYNQAILLVPGNQGIIAVGAMSYNEDGPNVPVKVSEGREVVFLFPSGQADILYVGFKVPSSYKVGMPITFKAGIYSPGTSGTILLSATSYLVRSSIDAIDSTTNSHASTNTAATNTSPANRMRVSIIDVTDSAGMINSVAVSAGDFLIVGLVRGTDTDTNDIRFVPRMTEVVFQ